MSFLKLIAQDGYPRIAIGGSIAYDYLTNVTYAGINKTSTYNSTFSDSSYCNFTDNTATVFINQTNQISVNLGGWLSTSDKYYVYAYIDWNRDGDWNDANETIVIATNITANLFPQTANITVPSNASTGSTRMRVVVRYNSVPVKSGRPAFSYGEAEDYSVNIVSAVSPSVTTQAVSSITNSSATGNGNITALGIPNPTAYGVCWNTSSTPTISDGKTDEGSASSTGAFTSSITGLSGKTTYCLRAYATNYDGTAYGSEVFFTTLNSYPTASNATVSANMNNDKIFSATSFNFSDDDVGDDLTAIKISSLETAGQLYVDTNSDGFVDGSEDVTLNQEISGENIAKLKFKPASDAISSPYATFEFKVSDGTNYSLISYTMTINVLDPYPRIAIGGSIAYDYLTNVTYAGINKTSTYNSTFSDSSYCNFTDNTATVFINQTNQISVNLGGWLSTSDKYYVYAYIDWNRDGDWNDANETIVIATNITANLFPQTTNITVPSDASIGTSRMRVIIRYNNVPVKSGHPAFSYGEAEDYKIVIEAVAPVELISFGGYRNNEEVILNWQTATEVNNYGFEVERAILNSELLILNWIKLGFVEGHGNSNSPKQYLFVDENLPSGTLLYRLKQIDTDGSFEYYGTIAEVDNTMTGLKDAAIPEEYLLSQNYPNPFNPMSNIKYQIANTGHVNLSVYDILGKKVMELVNQEQSPGFYRVKFDGSELASGIYIYRLFSGEFVSEKKLMLVK